MQLFRFANPAFLYLFLLLPVIIVLFIINEIRKKKALRRLGNMSYCYHPSCLKCPGQDP